MWSLGLILHEMMTLTHAMQKVNMFQLRETPQLSFIGLKSEELVEIC